MNLRDGGRRNRLVELRKKLGNRPSQRSLDLGDGLGFRKLLHPVEKTGEIVCNLGPDDIGPEGMLRTGGGVPTGPRVARLGSCCFAGSAGGAEPAAAAVAAPVAPDFGSLDPFDAPCSAFLGSDFASDFEGAPDSSIPPTIAPTSTVSPSAAL